MGRKILPQQFALDPEGLKELIKLRAGSRAVPRTLNVIHDTTNFLSVNFGDVVVIENHPYLVRNNEREGRFGLDDEPKFWVKRSIDLISGETKVLKLGFDESFRTQVGDQTFDFARSPAKEARILELVRGHRHFMQGYGARDRAGNMVRIIDYIRGTTLADEVLELGRDHEEYFFLYFPDICRTFIGLAEAIGFLHDAGEKHGDIRRDHIVRDSEGRTCRWIDFDYTFHNAANPYQYDLFGLGNILIYLVGRGDVTIHDLRLREDRRLEILGGEDMNIIFSNRVAGLRKIYPYIPEKLNRVLLHFSAGARLHYEFIGEFLDELYEGAADLAGAAAGAAEIHPREESDA